MDGRISVVTGHGDTAERMHKFRAELTKLINNYSMENGSNTPDYILADYLIRCLDSYNIVSKLRDTWYGMVHDGTPINKCAGCIWARDHGPKCELVPVDDSHMCPNAEDADKICLGTQLPKEPGEV